MSMWAVVGEGLIACLGPILMPTVVVRTKAEDVAWGTSLISTSNCGTKVAKLYVLVFG